MRRAPGRAPARLHRGEPHQREHRQRREDQEPRLEAAGELAREAERGRQVEAADAARHADQASHHADLAAEALRHELEHRAIARAQAVRDGAAKGALCLLKLFRFLAKMAKIL